MSEKEIKMSKYINDYGMAITVKAKEDDFLFIDGIDRKQYIYLLSIKFSELFSDKTRLLVAGLNSNSAVFVFDGGKEDMLRYTIRKVHISYSSYRRNRKKPVHFGPSRVETLENVVELNKKINNVRTKSDFVCTNFAD